MFADDIECSVLFNGDKSRNAVFLAIVSARWHAEEKHLELTYHHVFEGFIIRIIPANHPLISVQLLNKPAVLDLFQDRRVDEVIGVEVFHLRSSFGELVDDGLNAFAVRVGNSPDQSLGHLFISHLYQGQIVESGVLFQNV